MALYYERALVEGFKSGGPPRGEGGGQDPGRLQSPPEPTTGGGGPAGDAGQLHVLDGPVPGVFDDTEKGSWSLLRELLASAGKLPPVQKCLVRQVLQAVPKRQLPQAGQPPKWFRPGG